MPLDAWSCMANRGSGNCLCSGASMAPSRISRGTSAFGSTAENIYSHCAFPGLTHLRDALVQAYYIFRRWRPASICLDAGCPDHLAPLLGIFDDKFSEVSG